MGGGCTSGRPPLLSLAPSLGVVASPGGREVRGEARQAVLKCGGRSGLGVLVGTGGRRDRDGLAVGVAWSRWVLGGTCSSMGLLSYRTFISGSCCRVRQSLEESGGCPRSAS